MHRRSTLLDRPGAARCPVNAPHEQPWEGSWRGTGAPSPRKSRPSFSPVADGRQIQGNILQPFDGDHQAFLFLSFRNTRADARAWLGATVGRTDCTADVVAARADSRIAPGRSLMSVGLTASGLVKPS